MRVGRLQDGIDFANELHPDGERGFSDGAAELLHVSGLLF